MHNKTLKELSTLLHTKQVSSTELTRHYLDRIAASGHNAFLHVDVDLSLAQAKAADARLAEGSAGPLTGIPIAHKDIFVTKGWRSTAASKMLGNYVSPFDATVVEKFADAGMVTLGKLNCDEFAMGSANENSSFGAVKNPWDVLAVPGGSPGGSAAAIAARLAPAATGTDTGGSIRQPAAFCGITGIKPTYGRVSRYGMIAFASSLDQGGPMARTAEDCALLLNEMVGFDERDSTSLTPDQGNVREDFTLGLIADDFQAAFKDKCDVIMGPVAPSVAWDLGSKANDPVANYLADIFTLSTSLAGLPGMSIPVGFGQGEKNGKRPVGLQIIGDYFSEAKLLNIAHQYQQVTDWHNRTPDGV